MSEIGRLARSSPGEVLYLSGHIQTLDRRISIAIEGDETLCDQPRPSHRITTRARDGSTMDVGAAWLKTARHGPEKRQAFLLDPTRPPGTAISNKRRRLPG